MFPVMCSVLRRRELVKNAPFSLGRFGYAIVSGLSAYVHGIAWLT
jgi:hypothetical protein